MRICVTFFRSGINASSKWGPVYTVYDTLVDLYVTIAIGITLYRHVKRVRNSIDDEQTSLPYHAIIMQNVIRTTVLFLSNLATVILMLKVMSHTLMDTYISYDNHRARIKPFLSFIGLLPTFYSFCSLAMIQIWCKWLEVCENACSLTDHANKDHRLVHNHMKYSWIVSIDANHVVLSPIQLTNIDMIALLFMKTQVVHPCLLF